MPELPDVEALARTLGARCVGRSVQRVDLAAFSCLKTSGVAPGALGGLEVTGVERFGKHLCFAIGGIYLVVHFGRAGWLVWRDVQLTSPASLGRGPLALRVVFDDDSGFDLTEAGTRKRLAVWVVSDLGEVGSVASLGIEPLSSGFTLDALGEILDSAGGAQLKSVLRDQRRIAGIGNAYSDEILWTARLSPFAACARLTPDQRESLHQAILFVLTTAIDDLAGVDIKALKPHKKASYRVHARSGEPCPACGTEILEVSFADTSWQYCPSCQTGGKTLADRRMSRLLK